MSNCNYYCEYCGFIICADEKPDECPNCYLPSVVDGSFSVGASSESILFTGRHRSTEPMSMRVEEKKPTEDFFSFFGYNQPILKLSSDVLKLGSRGPEVMVVQEWLDFHDFSLLLDGIYGDVTETCVENFQKSNGIEVSGQVNSVTFAALVKPLADCLNYLSPKRMIRTRSLDIAQQFLAAKAREIGGENMGPWVRAVMDGHNGKSWPWCMGFVNWIVRKAQHSSGKDSLWPRTYSCSTMARWASKNNVFLRERDVAEGKEKIQPGYVFLSRKNNNKWYHTGFVLEVKEKGIVTIEGNYGGTVDRVKTRFLGFQGLDFIKL